MKILSGKIMNYKTLKIDNLDLFFNEIKKSGKNLLVTKKKGTTTYFSSFININDVDFNYIQTTISPKSVLFPKVEELISFKKDDGIYVMTEPNIEKETIVFGLRPCDAVGLEYLSNFFLNENSDFAVKLRKENTTLITLACKNFDENCFCTSVGLSPASTQGTDICLTDIGNGLFYVEIITDKGEKLIAEHSALFSNAEKINKENYVAQVPLKFDCDNFTKNIKDYYNSEKWVVNSLSCLGCGACAFVCPTCTCFDIEDETNLVCGTRLRCWDSCAFGIFTLHASGHNPKPMQSDRWRHRVLHKFYYSKTNMDTISCVGCGRCIRVCPAGMNILEQILDLQEA
jgi:NAD-dependent dihydropyrimidine dehydrogenase PreA subunit